MSIGVGSIADDTADKVRRNLVVFSAVVIAVSALEAQISGKFFGLENVETISEWRAWACVLVVLSYLFYRYKLDPTVEERWTKLLARRARTSAEIQRGLIHRQFNNVAEGFAPRGVKFQFSIPHAGLEFTKKSPRNIRLTGAREGDIEFDTYFPSDDGQKYAGIAQATFKISLPVHGVARLSAWAQHNRLNHEMLDLRFPYYLCFVAIMVAGTNLGLAVTKDLYACEAFTAGAECSTSVAPVGQDTQWKLLHLQRTTAEEKPARLPGEVLSRTDDQ